MRDEFSLQDDDVIVVPSQPAIAVYFNPRGDIVIRQESQYGDEDHWVYIVPANLMLVIDRLSQASEVLADRTSAEFCLSGHVRAIANPSVGPVLEVSQT